MTFALSSPAFRLGAKLPRKYAADGDNVSPPLEWRGAPPGTKSFALVVEEDMPTGAVRHWGLYNIAPRLGRLPEGIGRGGSREFGVALNAFGRSRYDGPKPPRGQGVHHYRFKIAALAVEALPEAAGSEADIWNAARAHALAVADLVATYER